MNAFLTEVRQVARGLFARPAFLAVTVLTLALGIGANTAIFSAVDVLLLKELPYPDSDRLVMLWRMAPNAVSRNRTSLTRAYYWNGNARFPRLNRSRALVSWVPR